MKKRYEETIVGIATGFSKGAISIIRLSGEDAIKIANSVFKEKNFIIPQLSHILCTPSHRHTN
jgi:tRNA U34 5-carboxymethylaminomethyl modifying GTPase MnmE/TrmE